MSVFNHEIEYRMKPLPWANMWDYREVIENNWWWDDLSNTEENWIAAVENNDFSRQYRCARDSYFEGNIDLAFERFKKLASHLEGIPEGYVKYSYVSQAINWLGIICEERGDIIAAQNWFEIGTERRDYLSFNGLNLARLLIAQSNFERAMALIDEMKEIVQDSLKGDIDYDWESDFLIHFLASQCHMGLGNEAESDKSFLKAISFQVFSTIQDSLWDLQKVLSHYRDYEFVQIDTFSSEILLAKKIGNPERLRIDLIQVMIGYEFSEKDLGLSALDRAKDLIPDILLAVKELKWPLGIANSDVEIYFAPDGSKTEKRVQLYP
jgi:tetratricopeptide (TPR) repeat protein